MQDDAVYNPIMYSEEQMNYVENHIEKHFGKFDEILHEIVSPDIHVDICVIKPSRKHNYYTLVTMGMGAREMDVPEKFRINNTRAELLISLPADWNLKSSEDADYWPLLWLKILARMPITDDTWLGWGHTIPNGQPFADNTSFAGIVLEHPYLFGKDCMTCRLPNGDVVNFYQMIPLYEEEMNFKIDKGIDEMFEHFDEDFTPVVDINRKNYFQDGVNAKIGDPGKSFNLSQASRSTNVTPDLERLKKYDIYQEKSKKDKLRTLMWCLVFGGITATLISKGYVWWSILPGVIVLYNLFLLVMQLIASPSMAFSSGLLVPGLVVGVNPIKLLVLAEMQSGEDDPTCWGLKMLSLNDWPEAHPKIGDRVPCASLFGGSFKGVWMNMEPRPLIWGTGDPDVLSEALSSIEDHEWEVLDQLKDKAMAAPKIEEDVMYFNEDLSER